LALSGLGFAYSILILNRNFLVGDFAGIKAFDLNVCVLSHGRFLSKKV
jgi:hypothetical protein